MGGLFSFPCNQWKSSPLTFGGRRVRQVPCSLILVGCIRMLLASTCCIRHFYVIGMDNFAWQMLWHVTFNVVVFLAIAWCQLTRVLRVLFAPEVLLPLWGLTRDIYLVQKERARILGNFHACMCPLRLKNSFWDSLCWSYSVRHLEWTIYVLICIEIDWYVCHNGWDWHLADNSKSWRGLRGLLLKTEPFIRGTS